MHFDGCVTFRPALTTRRVARLNAPKTRITGRRTGTLFMTAGHIDFDRAIDMTVHGGGEGNRA